MSGEWLPIETAPKEDDMEFLVLTKKTIHYLGGKIVKVTWCEDTEGFVIVDDTFSSDFPTYVEATHWMPLPEPPE